MPSIKTISLICCLISTLFTACEEKMTEDEISQIGITTCRKPAEFVKKLGFDANHSAFSTDNANVKGIELIQISQNPQDPNGRKSYQDSSWAKYGYMGSITTDDDGSAYCCPIPLVNTLGLTLSNINSVYKIDYLTGKMNLFKSLPKPDSVAGVVPYGPLGVYFDCHASKIYVATVAGSTRDEEKGVIYVLNKQTGEIEDQLKGFDAMGLCVGGFTGTKKLYFGSTRNSDIYTIQLDKKGHFKGKPKVEITLDQLGPRGDDKARRIRFDKFGNLLVFGIEFNYSLVAASQKPQTAYTFMYYGGDDKWALTKFE